MSTKPPQEDRPRVIEKITSLQAKSPFAQVKQAPALELLVELNLALTDLAAEEAALEQDLADVLSPPEAEKIASHVAATGGIAQRLANAVDRVKANTATLRELRRRAEDLKGLPSQA